MNAMISLTISCLHVRPASQRSAQRGQARLANRHVLRQALNSAAASRGTVAGSAGGPGSAAEDSRLFSNLGDDLRHEPGSVWGAAALVSGTAVGAGILAIPAVTAPAGFIAGSAAMTAAAAWSILSGLLIAEVSVNTMCELGTGRGVSLGSMARRTLGPAGAAAVSVVYTVLHYSLLVAYIAKAGETLHTMVGLPLPLADAAFTATLGALCFWARPAALDKANYVLVGGVVASFLALLAAAAGDVDPASLAAAHWDAVPQALPVIALSFVFQNCVPYVASSLEGDIWKIRTAIVAGVALPWMMFVAWDAVALGGAAAGQLADPVAGLRASGPAAAALVDAFTLLAVTTSFIGFVLGLSEFVAEALGLRAGRSGAAFALTLAPPFALALTFPGVFFQALDFAGTYGVLVLFGLIPVAMAWSERYAGSTLTRVQAAPGGRAVLAGVAVAAAGVIVDQLLAPAGH